MGQNQVKKVEPKTILRVALDVVWFAFLILIATFAISNVAAKKDENNPIPSVFGTGYLNVSSGSMVGSHEDSFNVGDLIIVNVVKFGTDGASNLKVGDIITYYGYVGGEKALVSHRIYAVEKIGDTIVSYKTVGDYYIDQTTPEAVADATALGVVPGDTSTYGQISTTVLTSEVKAYYKGKWNGAGKVISWFQTQAGFFVVVVLPTLIFLIFELISFIRSFIAYKQENAPKALTEEEKAAEREALKAQLLAELRAEALASQTEVPTKPVEEAPAEEVANEEEKPSEE